MSAVVHRPLSMLWRSNMRLLPPRRQLVSLVVVSCLCRCACILQIIQANFAQILNSFSCGFRARLGVDSCYAWSALRWRSKFGPAARKNVALASQKLPNPWCPPNPVTRNRNAVCHFSYDRNGNTTSLLPIEEKRKNATMPGYWE